jgi:hypothetical protein
MLSKEEISDELAKVMRAFADEPQNGERLAGLSPNEAWKQLSPSRPHVLLPDSLRYLLTTNQSEQTVTANGIRLKIGSELHHYFGSARLGELVGEKVRVFYNPDLPQIVSVTHPRTDPKAAQPFSVPLCKRLPANSATADDFAEVAEQRRKFAKYGRDSFRLIAPPSIMTMRDERLGTDELRATGTQIAEIEGGERKLQAARNNSRASIEQLATRQNLAIDPAKVRNPERVVSSLEEAEELERKLEAMEADSQ